MSTTQSELTLEKVAARLAEVEQELAMLRAEPAASAMQTINYRTSSDLPAERASRRWLLRSALGAAAATVGGGVLLEAQAGVARATGAEGQTTFTSITSTPTVIAKNSGGGAGMAGVSAGSYGGVFQGGKAPLHLAPASAVGAPTAGAYLLGDLFVDADGTMFICTAAGTPGTWASLCSAVHEVRAYGAIGDGTSHPLSQRYATLAAAQAVYPFVTALTQEIDWAAIQAAIQAAQQLGGGRVVFEPGSYFLGTYTNYANILAFTNLSNLVFDGNGAELYCTTTDQSHPYMFSLTNPSNLTFSDLRFRDTGTDLGVTWQGAWAIYLQASDSPGSGGSIQINNCSGTSLVGFLAIAGNYAYRIRTITLINCRVSNSYYGINCQENGDNLTAVNFRCENVLRAYFPYGVTNHNVDLSIYHDGTSPGSNGCIDIKRYARDTMNIRVRAVFEGSGLQYGAYVNLEHQPVVGTGNGLIEDIDIDVHASALSDNVGYVVRFRSLLTDGTEETTTTNNRWNRIRIAGSFGTGGNTANPIYLIVRQAVEGALYLDPSITEAISLTRPHYPGFVVRTAHDRELRTIQGNLTTQDIVIPLAQLDSNAFALRVMVYAHDDYTALAVQNATYSEDVLIGYNAGGGPVGLQVVQNLHVVSQGSAAVISYAANGENFTVGFSGTVYSNANAFACAQVQYIGRGPQY